MAASGPSLSRSLPQMYVAAALRLALPLTVLPLVAVRVGPEAFGRISFILVWGSLLSVLVEGGFLAAATRLAVASDLAGRRLLAQQIFTARCVLTLPVVLLAGGVVWWVEPTASASAWVDALAIATLACALGWTATWYLQATQQLHHWAQVEMAVYAAMVVGCWFFAHSVLAFLVLQVLGCAVLAGAGWYWVRRDLAVPLWAPAELKAGLRLGWTMLPVSLAGAAYSFALPAAASAVMPKAELGLYFMADRIVRSLSLGADPALAVIYPRIVLLFQRGEGAALRLALRWAAGGALAGLALVALGEWLWPLLQPFFASRQGGLDLVRLHGVLAIVVWVLPLLWSWKFVGYWMLGSGRYDRAYRGSMIIGAIVGVTAAATVGGAAGATGLAWTALGIESLVIALAVGGILLTRRLS